MKDVNNKVRNMSIYKRKENRLEGRLTINGVRKSFYGATKAQVQQKARDYLMKVENGYREPMKITLNEYIEYWLKTYKKNKIEPSSYTRLYRVYDCQIRNTLGKKVLGKISTSDIQQLIDEHANPTKEGVTPLALSGLKRILHLLKPCFKMAVMEGVIPMNPCDHVVLPTASCVRTETKKQITLDDAQIFEFRDAALSRYKTTNEYCSRDFIVLLVMLNLGLRVGECLALEWSDFDFDKHVVRINKTIQSNIIDFEDEKNSIVNLVKKSTKTSAGMRVLKLNETVEFYLKELQAYDERNGIISSFFCCTNAGTRNCARNMQRSLDRLIRKTKIKEERVTLHTLRHSFGSTLLRNNVPIEVVSKLLGHANINITYAKYIHVIQEQQAMAMDMVCVC